MPDARCRGLMCVPRRSPRWAVRTGAPGVGPEYSNTLNSWSFSIAQWLPTPTGCGPSWAWDGAPRQTLVEVVMRSLWLALVHLLSTAFRRRLALQLEIVALRHQLVGLRANSTAAISARTRRPRALVVARALLAWMARRTSIRPAADRARVAEAPLPRALAPQERGRSARSTGHRPETSRAHPQDLAGESNLGITAHRRRAGQARYRGGEVDRREVSDPSVGISVADLEGVSREPREGPRLHRLLRRADREIRDSLRPDRSRPRAAPDRSLQCHRESDGSVDGAADGRGVPVRYSRRGT